MPIQPVTANLPLPLIFLALLLAPAAAEAGKYNPVLDIGDKAPAWKDLPGVDGKNHSLSDLKDKSVVVVVFTCNSCPYAVDYEDRLIDFAKAHTAEDKDVALVAINVNKVPADRLEKMKERAEEKGFNFPYLYDDTQQLAKDYGATYTPEFFVLNKDRQIAYMGAFDDNTMADKVTETYVPTAVAAALKNEKPEVTETVARGCTIRWERRRQRD